MTQFEFNSMLATVQEPLYYFSSRFYKTTDDRLDLVQETITKALFNREKFNAGTNFKAWVFTIMKNTFINEYKKNLRKKENTSSEDVYENARFFVENETPDHIFQRNEFDEKVKQMDTKYSQPLKMYHEGFKYEEISEKLYLPLGTVKNRIHSARNILLSTYN
jgi:RNA polymerase sigma-70 factor, ECF subfamily